MAQEIVVEGNISLRDLIKVIEHYQEIRIYNISERKVKMIKEILKEKTLVYHEKIITKGITRIDTEKAIIFIFKI